MAPDIMYQSKEPEELPVSFDICQENFFLLDRQGQDCKWTFRSLKKQQKNYKKNSKMTSNKGLWKLWIKRNSKNSKQKFKVIFTYYSVLEKNFWIIFETSLIIVNLAVESSSDEDEESSEDEKMETETAEKEPEAPKKGEKFRSGYGSD